MTNLPVASCENGHQWIIAKLPISLSAFVNALKKPCPECGSTKTFAGEVPITEPGYGHGV